jgi:hypothetical protein
MGICPNFPFTTGHPHMIGEEALQAFNRSTVHSGVLENQLERNFEAPVGRRSNPPGLLKAFEGLPVCGGLKSEVPGPCLKVFVGVRRCSRAFVVETEPNLRRLHSGKFKVSC